MDAKDFRGAGLIAIVAVEDALDESFFEFPDGLVEENATLDHLKYQAFQLISHSGLSPSE